MEVPTDQVIWIPCLYVGDLNNYSVERGYDDNDDQGNKFHNWIIFYNMKLMYNNKEKGTFRSARRSKDYTPYLCMVLRHSLSDNTMATKNVLGNFPNSQHRPVVLDYGLQISLIRSIPKPHRNFRKADRGNYEKELDHMDPT